MQALYAFFQSEDDRVEQHNEKLLKNIYAIYDLYIYQLSFLIEIIEFARETIEISKNKFFPTEEEANPNTRFIDNLVISYIENNSDYKKKFSNLHINWSEQKDLVRRLFLQIKESENYKKYMTSEKSGAEEDVKVLEDIMDDYIAVNEELQQYYEDLNIYWADDYDVACYMVIKTLKYISLPGNKDKSLPKLFGNRTVDDEKEEVDFIRDLFCKTILHSNEFDDMIEAKTDNWEIDRIAMMDMLLLKMALCEFTCFPTIPTKVTINEYIEISKFYSTPKSRIFINGILDKLLFDLLEKKKINKTGRGLIG